MQLLEALELISSFEIEPPYETLNLEEALGRVSAQDYFAKVALPRFNNSAMDGYAITLSTKEAKVIEVVFAGEEATKEVKDNQAIKIMTGAKVPKGTQAIVPIEEVERKGDKIYLPSTIKPNANIRFKGEDVKEKELVLAKGEKITPYKIALLASQGYSFIKVYQKPKITLFATGNELKMYYETLENSQIYNSNAPALIARCKELGCEVSFLGKVEDSLEATKKAILNSLKKSDLILTTGGVSVGDADYTKKAFEELGMTPFFTKLAVKPGKPTTLGKLKDSFILSLAGNPLAAVLNFEILGRVLINKLKGQKEFFLKPIHAKLSEKINLKGDRAVIIPGIFDGNYFTPLKASSGMVKPSALMNGFIISRKKKVEGEVKFIPLWDFYSSKFEEIFS
ncbi:MAG: molybdopterin molybdotransferase MoeA [Epsilonproteobacteria bacterium]|nr:molybdopterin molybdotransferase MoeA [Campylobacterota bacterium]